MRGIFVILLLACVHARNPIDQLGEKLANKVSDMLTDSYHEWMTHRVGDSNSTERLGTRLADRAFTVWSPNHALMEGTMHAKPGAKTATKTGAFRSVRESILGASSLNAPFKASKYAFQLGSWTRPLKYAAEATAEQADVPALQIPVNEEPATAQASAGEGLEYLGRLSQFPLSMQKMATSEEAARLSIAGLTPAETPVDTPRGKLQDGAAPAAGTLQDEASPWKIQAEERVTNIPEMIWSDTDSDGFETFSKLHDESDTSPMIWSDSDSDVDWSHGLWSGSSTDIPKTMPSKLHSELSTHK